MRTFVKHTAPVLVQYSYLRGADVPVKPSAKPHPVTDQCPEGQLSNHTITGPKTVPSFWQLEAYSR
jgi:hypothetical protein